MMQATFETIRALRTRFVVIKNSRDEVTFSVDEARSGDAHGPAIIRFVSPAHTWASVWDDARTEWRDVLGFQIPEHGEINEAFVKAVGHRVKVSFTNMRSPLLRWGFTANNVEVTVKE